MVVKRYMDRTSMTRSATDAYLVNNHLLTLFKSLRDESWISLTMSQVKFTLLRVIKLHFDVSYMVGKMSEYSNSELKIICERQLMGAMTRYKEGKDSGELIKVGLSCATIYPPLLFEGDGESIDVMEEIMDDKEEEEGGSDDKTRTLTPRRFPLTTSTTTNNTHQHNKRVTVKIKIFHAYNLLFNHSNSSSNDGANVYVTYQFDGQQKPHATRSEHATSTGYCNFNDENKFEVIGSTTYWNRRLLGNSSTSFTVKGGGGDVSSARGGEVEECMERIGDVGGVLKVCIYEKGALDWLVGQKAESDGMSGGAVNVKSGKSSRYNPFTGEVVANVGDNLIGWVDVDLMTIVINQNNEVDGLYHLVDSKGGRVGQIRVGVNLDIVPGTGGDVGSIYELVYNKKRLERSDDGGGGVVEGGEYEEEESSSDFFVHPPNVTSSINFEDMRLQQLSLGTENRRSLSSVMQSLEKIHDKLKGGGTRDSNTSLPRASPVTVPVAVEPPPAATTRLSVDSEDSGLWGLMESEPFIGGGGYDSDPEIMLRNDRDQMPGAATLRGSVTFDSNNNTPDRIVLKNKQVEKRKQEQKMLSRSMNFAKNYTGRMIYAKDDASNNDASEKPVNLRGSYSQGGNVENAIIAAKKRRELINAVALKSKENRKKKQLEAEIEEEKREEFKEQQEEEEKEGER